ncbi:MULTISPECIES: hypothetical protein [Weeksella]|uniref:hypothetical protein n=1 Tax=Weeksella TaxID=1013 RepID=UPI00114CA6FB|nr:MULTISPECIES: hypothetical protein [Weeksella]MDK7375346.1 hypothetical protein [Weeksella virosa]
MRKCFLLLFFATIFFSCIKGEHTKFSEIFIVYETEIIDGKKRDYCGDIDEATNEDLYKTVEITSYDYEYIINETNRLGSIQKDFSNDSIRFNTELTAYIKESKTYICISNENIIKINDNIVSSIGDSLVYVLKAKSGFYNFYDSVDLFEDDKLIQKYGLPKNYKRNESSDKLLIGLVPESIKLQVK